MNLCKTFSEGLSKSFAPCLTATTFVSLLLSPTNSYSAALCDVSANDLGGNVYRDYNSNGRSDNLELGFTTPVTVTAYDLNGVAATTTTDADGDYHLDAIFAGRTGDDANIRLEFSGLPSWANEGVAGSNSGTTVQFHSAASCAADLAVQNPAEYCQDNPEVGATCFVQGRQDTQTVDTLVNFPYNAASQLDGNVNGTNTNGNYGANPPPVPNKLANAAQTGSTYGLAYERQTKTLYSSAYAKRGTGFGPNGPGAIYKTDVSNPATLVVSLFVDLNALFIGDPAGDDPRPNSGDFGFGLAANDIVISDVMPESSISKLSFGDIEVSPDGGTLYAVNLADKRLYAIPTSAPSAANIVSYPIPDTSLPTSRAGASAMTCTESDVRPFGLGFDGQNRLHIGAVCSAESTQNADDLMAYVWRLDGTTFTRVMSDPIFYDRGSDGFYTFKPWSNGTATNTKAIRGPMLSDIAFDGEDMLIGLRDRAGDRRLPFTGTPGGTAQNEFQFSLGDLLRACPDATGTSFNFESASICGTNPATAGATNGEGPGGGEFYFMDYLADNTAVEPNVSENALGSILQIPGKPNVMTTASDPVFFNTDGSRWVNFNSAGVNLHNNNNGRQTGAYDIYSNGFVSQFAKTGGIGDIEAFCDVAPLEVGNFVWFDADKDGIQDPNEIPLAGVTVQIIKQGSGLAIEAITGPNGEYYFVDSSDPRLQPGGIWATTIPPYVGVVTPAAGGLLPNMSYEISINTAHSALENYLLTTANANSGTSLPDSVDSDAIQAANNNFALISITTGDAGSHDHSSDFGFFSALGSIQGNVSEDVNGDGMIDSSDNPIANVTIQLLDSQGNAVIDTNTNAPITTITDAMGNYSFENLQPGDYQIIEIQPGGFVSVSDVDTGDNDNMIGGGTPITVVAGEVSPGNDFIERRDLSTQPIPTLSEWALILLTLLLGLFGYRQGLVRGKEF